MGLKENSTFQDEGDNKERLQAPANFDGPVANRRCTDILFALLLLVMWVAMTAVGVHSWTHGNYRVVLYPMDWAGNTCGTNFGERDMTGFPKLVYINILGGVCVKECPKIDDLVDTSSFITYGGVFQGPNATLPDDFVEVGNYTDIEGVMYCTDDDCPTNNYTSYFKKGVNQGKGYAYYALDTIEVLGVRCIANPKALEKLDELILTPSLKLNAAKTGGKGKGKGKRLLKSLKTSEVPSSQPSSGPSSVPSLGPSSGPSSQPSSFPSLTPSSQPSSMPSQVPSLTPSLRPSSEPSLVPSSIPSNVPSQVTPYVLSLAPSSEPSFQPSSGPSSVSSQVPSLLPSLKTSEVPSSQPSSGPSSVPSLGPSSGPSSQPSSVPSLTPSSQPSCVPSQIPSLTPSLRPSKAPSIDAGGKGKGKGSKSNKTGGKGKGKGKGKGSKSNKTGSIPSHRPSYQPSLVPSLTPSSQPSSVPSQVHCSKASATLVQSSTSINQSINHPLVDLNSLNEFRNVWNNLYGDIYEARYPIMLFGALAAMLVGFVYAQLLRVQYLLGTMIWGSIVGSIGIIIGCGVYAFMIANKWSEADPQEKGNNDIIAAKICAYVLWGIGGTITVITIFLRKQIMLSMACVRAACRALSDMPTMIFFPVIQVIGLAAFMLIWLVYAVHLASTGEITKTQLPTTVDISVRTYVFDDFTKKCGWYLIFCFFWTVAFIAAMGQIVIAMTVSKWYFTRDKSRLGIFTIFVSIIEATRYHIGTAAFGSFIIAVVQMIRAMVSRLQKKARELNNKVGEALLCCCQCLLWCFEKFIKFMNKNAYIQTAIFGTPFCRSAREAFSLIVRNAGKVASISYVSTLVLFVGRIFISSLTTGSAYVYMDHYIGGKLYSTAGPCAVIFFMSYYVGGMFLDIFDMSTSTILQCFVADEEMFDGDENYAEGDLRKWLDDFEEEENRIVAGK